MKLNERQAQAAALLVQGMSCKAVAEKVGVTPQTISTWKKDFEFRAQINALKLQVLTDARDALQRLAPEAIDVLRDLMGQASNEEVRRKAAVNILEAVGLHGDPRREGLRYGWGIGPTTSEKIEEQENAYSRLLGGAFR